MPSFQPFAAPESNVACSVRFSSSKPVRSVLHIQKCPLRQEEFRQLLSLERVQVAAAQSFPDALEWCRAQCPDILVLDREMEGSAESLRQVASLRLPVQIVLLAARASLAALYEVERFDLAGLVVKQAITMKTLSSVFNDLAAGRRVLPVGAQKAWRTYKARPDAFTKRLRDEAIALLPRFASGETDAQIAAATGKMEKTIMWRRYDTMRRLDFHRTIDFILWIREMGFAGDRAGADAERS